MKTPRRLLLLLSLCGSSLFAGNDRIERIQMEPWERDIGYVQIARVGNLVYLSGCTGRGAMPEAVKEAYVALRRSLEKCGLGFADVLKENVYTTDIEALKAQQPLRKAIYGDKHPAATWVQVSRLYSPEDVIEIELIAVAPETPK